MTCREVVDLLMDYLSGELSSEQRSVFEAHLAICPPCVAYVESYKEAIKLGKAVFDHPEERIPGDVPEALVQAILAARKKQS